MMCGMSSLVELAHMLDSEVSKASDEDGRFIRAGENDRWIRSKGERDAATKGQAGAAGRGLAVGGGIGAAAGAAGMLALRARGKRKLAAQFGGGQQGKTIGGWLTPKKRAAAGVGAAAGGIAGGGIGADINMANNQHRQANKWREEQGLSPRNYWSGKPRD